MRRKDCQQDHAKFAPMQNEKKVDMTVLYAEKSLLYVLFNLLRFTIQNKNFSFSKKLVLTENKC